MKLARFGAVGFERPAVLTNDEQRLDLSGHFPDWNQRFFAEDGIAGLKALLESDADRLPRLAANIRTGAPIARPGKIVCIGLNFADHAKESGMPVPAEPTVFLKAPNTVVGPYDNIVIPRGSTKTDWEVELGVIIGKEARYLDSPEQAASHIAGYVLTHDVSERAFQMERGGQWTKGKSCDSFNPLGPFLLTSDELPDPGQLAMGLSVNGVRRQHGHTNTMVFNVFALVHYVSQFMTLEPGDLISTGTPPGVGLGMQPPQYLKSGDEVELWIERLGAQRQVCISA